MCGIVGLFLKTEKHRPELGRLTAVMLHEMKDRGPDSAGFAIYDAGVEGVTRITLLSEGHETDWTSTAADLEAAIGAPVIVRPIEDHAVFETTGDGRAARQWIIENVPGVDVLSYGNQVELFKSVGDPDLVAARYDLASRTGTHAIAHTRMATESAVTTNGSHPFVTGSDTCLIHNGSLSNHNQLRRRLEQRGESFQTENDSEVAAGYLSWRLREGDTIEAALEQALVDLDGFYTFAIGVRDGFAILRDPIACKPAVVAETDDWVAMSSEYRAIAQLPGVDDATVWEPEPARVYTWSLAAPAAGATSNSLDMGELTLREVNQALHSARDGTFRVLNPRGAHAVAAGVATDIHVEVVGSVGYYCAGMHQTGTVRVDGNASTGLAENIMSGTVHITGSATMSAGASGHGGVVIIDGNAGARCGISMKGVDIVVGGDVGHMSAFMAQSGNLVVLGEADSDLGDSIYEANLFVRGNVDSLGSDCVEKDLRPEHLETLADLLAAAGMSASPADFRRYGSARELYNFHVDDIDAELAGRQGAKT